MWGGSQTGTLEAGESTAWRRVRARLRRHNAFPTLVSSYMTRWLASGRILDLACGAGNSARALHAAGYDVFCADLYPPEDDDLPSVKVDVERPLPYADGVFDGIVATELIEHIDAQVAFLRELHRVLRPGGILLLSAPNLLHLEGRLHRMLSGHAFRNRAIVAEGAGYWDGGRKDPASPQYFGHVFLIDLYQLRFYLKHVGFEIVEIDTPKLSPKSLALSPLLLPVVWWSTRRSIRRARSRVFIGARAELERQVLSMPALFGRKLVLVARRPELEPRDGGRSKSRPRP